MAHRLARVSFRAALAGIALFVLTVAAFAAPFAYITLGLDNQVSVIDLATERLITNIPVGTQPFAIAAHPAGTRVYVGNIGNDTVSVIDTASNRVIGSISVATGPAALAVNPSGTRLVVASAGTNASAGNKVTVIDTATNAVISVVMVGPAPFGLAFSPSGDRLYVSSVTSNAITVLDGSTFALASTITLATPASLGVAVNPQGTRLYATFGGINDRQGNAVAVVDIASGRTISQITVPNVPFQVVLNTAGTRAYVASVIGNCVSVIDTASNTVISTIPADPGAGPGMLGLSPDGSKLYVINSDKNSIAVYSTANYARLSTITTGRQPLSYGNFIVAGTTSAASTPGALSGLWWNANESGWGINFTQRGNIIFAAWYTYDSSGNPKWYVASNCTMPNASSCSGALYQVVTNARFFGAPFNPSANVVTTAGSLSVSFTDANNGSMSYTLNGQSRTVPIQRQPISGGTVPGVNYTDLWWNPNESGWGMAITQQGSVMFLAWYVYNDSGQPVWYVASNCAVSAAGNSCSGTLYRTVGPPFGPAFNPSAVQVSAAGTVTLTFGDANNGVISYTVNGVSGTKSITRQLF